MSLFPPPEILETSVYVDVVAQLGLKPRNAPWTNPSNPTPIHSFLEGPVFDRDANLYMVDAPFGQILKVTPQRAVSVVCRYDGVPNGLALHRDGDIYIADRINGIMRLDPISGKVETFLGKDALGPDFKGPNDLVFHSNGDLFFTDQGDTGMHDPTGRVFRLTAGGRLDCLLDNVPSPNGIVLNPDEDQLFVAVTFAQQVWRCPLLPDGKIVKVGVYQSFSGGFSGPDGLAMNIEGGLAVCHNRMGSVWIFDGLGRPTYRLVSCAGLMTTNMAYGGPGRKTAFITESASGRVLIADLPVAGVDMLKA